MSLEIKEILRIAESRLGEAGCGEARLDADELLCFLLRLDRGKLFMKWNDVLNDKLCEAYFDLVDLRAGRKPLHYITGSREFMGIDFAVDERVLIPRQDTEILVEAVLDYIRAERPAGRRLRLLDIGAGSGAIAVSLCKYNDDIRAVATDISQDALAVAKKNAAAAGTAGAIKFVRSDIFEGLKRSSSLFGFDIIVSNPPYIRSETLRELEPEIRDHEPAAALDGGPDGLDAYRRIIAGAGGRLKKDGALFLEIGFDQAEDVSALLNDEGRFEAPSIFKDLAGSDRVVFAKVTKS
jgi:release factor glutamine methyltransferase